MVRWETVLFDGCMSMGGDSGKVRDSEKFFKAAQFQFSETA